jgi:hypothetical protein
VARAARALAGIPPVGSPRPFPEWSFEEARSGRAIAAAVRSLAGAVPDAALRVLDGVAGALRARPLLWVAGAVLLVPLLQVLLPARAAVACAVLLATAAGMSLLLAAVERLYEGEYRVLVERVLVVALLFRAAVGAAIHASGGFPDEFTYYHAFAADSAACWRLGGPSPMAGHFVVEGRAAYFYVLSAAYTLLGTSMVVGRMLGTLIGLAGSLVAGEVARPLGGARAAAFAVAVLALHPEHAFWNATLSRDGLAALLVLLALAVHLRRPGGLLRGNLLLVAAPLGLLALNSFVVAGALSAAFVLAAMAEAAAGGWRGAGRVLRVVGVSLLALGALVFVGWGYGNLFTPELFSAVRSQPINTAPDFLPGVAFGNAVEVLAFVPIGASFVLFAPWPWDAVHAHRAAYGLLAALGLVVTLAGLAGLGIAARRRPWLAAVPILYGVLHLSLLSLLEGTTGIVIRHRLPLTALFAVGTGVLLAGIRRPAAR